jgi:hypothetical protein
MNDDDANFTTPPEDFEIIEVDCEPFLTEEQRSWPVVDLIQEEDFAIEEPLPVLLVTPTSGDPNETEKGFPALIAAVSDYEVSLGGEGLHLFDTPRPNGVERNGSIALSPWKAEGAASDWSKLRAGSSLRVGSPRRQALPEITSSQFLSLVIARLLPSGR